MGQILSSAVHCFGFSDSQPEPNDGTTPNEPLSSPVQPDMPLSLPLPAVAFARNHGTPGGVTPPCLDKHANGSELFRSPLNSMASDQRFKQIRNTPKIRTPFGNAGYAANQTTPFSGASGVSSNDWKSPA